MKTDVLMRRRVLSQQLDPGSRYFRARKGAGVYLPIDGVLQRRPEHPGGAGVRMGRTVTLVNILQMFICVFTNAD